MREVAAMRDTVECAMSVPASFLRSLAMHYARRRFRGGAKETKIRILRTLRIIVVLNMLKLSSFTLRKAAGIQEEIEKLDFELRNLLAEARKPEDGRGTKNLIASRVSTPVKKSRPRTGVAAGVRRILKVQGKSMKVGEIYRRLLASGYSFRSSNPKNSLTAQMYRMRGVRRTGPGEFKAA
jgi:hypothetical protein